MKASISVDIDTLKDYSQTYGINFKSSFDPIYETALPRLIELLDKHELKATFFVVGKDMENTKHLKVLKKIAEGGHEIANHTYSHTHAFHKLSSKKQEHEIQKCHQLACEKLNVKILGFRAPGYNIHEESLASLKKMGYLYDSSSFPTILLPVMKAMIKSKSKRKNKSSGGGKLVNIIKPTKPYIINKTKIVEIPVSSSPFIRIPFMGTFNISTGNYIFKTTYFQFKFLKRDINYEIHPIELLSLNEDSLDKRFSLHPGIKRPLNYKIEMYDWLFKNLKKDYAVVTLKDFAKLSK